MPIHKLGPFRLDSQHDLLLREGAPVPLGRRAIALLRTFLEQPGTLISKDVLIEAAWSGRLVEESNLPVQIAALRRVLGEAPGGDRWIETMPGRGYRFIGPIVTEIENGATSPPQVGTVPGPASIPRADAERRQITALYCELIGILGRGDGVSLEDLREEIAAFQYRISETVDRHDGFVVSRVGNTALVFFGYPAAHEYDAEQAVRAGLDLCAAVRALGSGRDRPMRCRVGIATGMAIIGDLAREGVGQDREIIGDAPNLARRLLSSARSDIVAIEQGTRRLIGNLFECRDLDAIDAASGIDPIRVWQVLRESAVASRFEALRGSALSPLIGRDEELDVLLRRWASAKAGIGQVVLVSGEPGLGKSRLVAVLGERLQAQPHHRLRYFCSPYHQDSALYPFIEQLGRAAGFARDDVPAANVKKIEVLLADAAPTDEDVALLADLMSLPASERHPLPKLNPQRKKERTLEALIHQLEGLAHRQPVLMVFEDAHWLDPTSYELLDLAVERMRHLSVLLIVTFRPGFQPPWIGQPRVTMLALNRLDRAEGTALVKQIAEKAVPGEVVAQIIDRTDGVPLFIEELTKSVLEGGLLREEDGRYSLEAALPSFAIPATLHDSLLARLDRLGSARQVAQIGAAIGRQFPYALLRAVCHLPDDELQATLSRLVASELVLQRGAPPAAEYLFKHALVQDSAYSTLLRGPRQALHRRIAEALEQRFPDLVETQPEIVAHHYGEAAIADKAIIYWHLAGKLSATKSAVREAIAQLRRGLSLLGGLPETRERNQLELDIHVTLTAALMAGKGYANPETIAALERANQLVTETEAVGTPLHFRVLYGLWLSTLNTGTIAAAFEQATNFLSIAQSQPASGPLLIGHRSLAHSLMYSGDHRAALAHFETAASLYRPEEHRDSALQYGQDIGVSAFVMLSWALWHRGYPDRSARAADRAVVYSRELGHAPALSNVFWFAGMAAVFARDIATVHAYGNDCVAVASQHGFALWAAAGQILQGWADAQRGEAATGIARIRDGMAASEATGTRLSRSLFLTLLAEALALAGEIEAALAALDDALATAAASGTRGWDAEIHRLRGELTARLPYLYPAKTEDSFRTALAIAREQGARGYELRAATSLARLWGKQGRREEACHLLTPLYGSFTEGFDTADLKVAKLLLEELA